MSRRTIDRCHDSVRVFKTYGPPIILLDGIFAREPSKYLGFFDCARNFRARALAHPRESTTTFDCRQSFIFLLNHKSTREPGSLLTRAPSLM